MANLNNLPAELLDQILEPVEVGDLCNVRLVSRRLARDAVNESFLSLFRRRRVWLTEPSLVAFERVTRQKTSLACLLEELVIVGPVFHTNIRLRGELNEEVLFD